MLVKKVDSEWKPSENPGLRVGETVDISDPRQLIIEGKVIGIDSEGFEVSAYELYGVLTEREKKDLKEYLTYRKEFKQYIEMKKAAALNAQLEAEKDNLKTQIEELKKTTQETPVKSKKK